MPSRRQFLKQSGLLTTGFIVYKDDFFRKKAPIGVQLYTLRNEMGKDPKGTLGKVAQLGYKQVETFGYGNRKWFGLTASEFSTVLKSNGLTSPSGHLSPAGMFLQNNWQDNWKVTMEDAKAIGQQFMVVPWMEEKDRKIENYKRIASELNKAGEMANAAGLKLAYHNHDFEFENVNGENGFDILTRGTDPKLVNFELDIYWAVKAGHDPIKLFEQHPKRFPLWHVKDMDKTDRKFFTEVGNGVIDFAAIFKKAKQAGMKYFFVEQDFCPGPPLESIAKSIAYLQKNIVK